MKALGRQVAGFHEKVWKKHRWEIVYDNNNAKFNQNPHLLQSLMDTAGGDLVEASPSDRVWGIGMHEKDARKVDPSRWKGLNLLGKILTQLREDILAEQTQKETEEEEDDDDEGSGSDAVSDGESDDSGDYVYY